MALNPTAYRGNVTPIDTIDLDDGRRFPIPPPTVWPDAAQALAANGELADAARLIIGAEAFDAFTANGGTAAMLFDHIGQFLGDETGPANLGESSASES